MILGRAVRACCDYVSVWSDSHPVRRARANLAFYLMDLIFAKPRLIYGDRPGRSVLASIAAICSVASARRAYHKDTCRRLQLESDRKARWGEARR
jgi:hypothetical protein